MKAYKSPIVRQHFTMIAFGAVLALLLATLFVAGYGAVADTTETDILFQDNFDDPDTSLTDRGWIDHDSTTAPGTQLQQIVDGKVLLRQATNEGVLFVPAQRLENVSDYIVEVDIGWPVVSTTPIKNNRMAAVVVRSTNNTAEKSNGYEFALLENTNGRQVRAYGRSVGTPAVNTSKKFSFELGDMVHFKVVVQGSHFECYINGAAEPTFTFDHSGLAAGGVGFKVSNGDAYYDNLVVRRIPKTPESTGGTSDTDPSGSESTESPTSTTQRVIPSRPAPAVFTTAAPSVPEDTGFSDRKDAVEVSAKPGVVPTGASLVAVEGTSVPAGATAGVLAKYGDKAVIGTAYVLGLEDAAGMPLEGITLEGALSARIKLKEADVQAGSLKLVRFGTDGTPFEVDASFADGHVSFDTAELGFYAVILTQGRPTSAAVTAPTGGGSPHTGFSLVLTLSLLTLVVAALTVLLLMRRHEKNRNPS